MFACACIVCLCGTKGMCFTLEKIREARGVKPLTLSQRREVCRIDRTYSDTSEAKDTLGKTLSQCSKPTYADALAHFCVNQCSKQSHKTCLSGCEEVCAPWERSQRALYAHNSSKAEKVLKGVWQCMTKKETTAIWSQYTALRDTALKRHKEAFLSAEKDCEEAGADFLISLTKVCEVLHDMKVLEKKLSEDTSLPMEAITLDTINHYIHNAQKEETMTWLAARETLTPQSLSTTCRILRDVIMQSLAALQAFEKEGDSEDKEEINKNVA